jgi:BirA family biotin operon repressor/biotin-[acetyl-CoA-carboxylase] ligase
MQQLQEKLAGHGAAYFAHHQTAGRGQRGHKWSDEPGQGIAVSVILDASFLSPSQPFPLVCMVALSAYDLLTKYIPEDLSLKWPNDLYWRDRKAGGILIESQVRGTQWTGAVAGIGININQDTFPDYLQHAVSLKQITGQEYDPVSLARELCHCLELRYRELIAGGFPQQLASYNDRLYKKGSSVIFRKETTRFTGKVIGVSERGKLRLSNAPFTELQFGEAEWVIGS